MPVEGEYPITPGGTRRQGFDIGASLGLQTITSYYLRLGTLAIRLQYVVYYTSSVEICMYGVNML